MPFVQSLDDFLAEARSGLDRLSPAAALAATRDGALLVDIRPSEQRRAGGEIPGALVVDRNVLEWRLAPSSKWRIAEARTDRQVILVCNQGYQSSLAARDLQRLGVHGATDVVGGFEAWRAAGLPVSKPG